MFGLMNKLSALKKSVTKVQNQDMLEAIVAASILVAYADGDCSAEEISNLCNIIEANDNLRHFGSEIGKIVDRYATMYEAGKRIAKVKLMKEIKDVVSNEQQAEEVFIIAIEIADADGEVGVEEMAVLQSIGKELGLKVDDYL